MVAGSAYIFGGEVEPRKPIDNDIHIITLPFSGAPADYYTVPAKASSKTQLAELSGPTAEEDDEAATEGRDLTEVPLSSPPPSQTSPKPEASSSADQGKSPKSEVPSPRIGHATAVIGSRIFLFGGRGGSSDTLEERGRVWVFETKTHSWDYLDPHRDSPIPPARSYFAAVATDKPRDFAMKPIRPSETWKEWAEGNSAEVGIPQRPIAGHVAVTATDEEDAGFGTLIIHGGCLSDGTRTNDVWAFDVRSKMWKELPSAPGDARGGPALALAKSRLYRFGGFDGTSELGGQLDVLELCVDEFDDRVSKGEVGVFARGGWVSIVPSLPTIETTNLVAEEWPGNRSVAGLEFVMGGGGREYLVLMLGEQSPSGKGHEAAGQFWADVWAFQVPPLGMTAVSFSDAVWQAMGKSTGEGKWRKVSIGPFDDEVTMDIQGPEARGWLATAPMGDLEENGIVIFGGLNEKNRRLGDGWIFRLD